MCYFRCCSVCFLNATLVFARDISSRYFTHIATDTDIESAFRVIVTGFCWSESQVGYPAFLFVFQLCYLPIW